VPGYIRFILSIGVVSDLIFLLVFYVFSKVSTMKQYRIRIRGPE
jgi:hypothetical protein